jgi:uncharacterized membrane protein YccC
MTQSAVSLNIGNLATGLRSVTPALLFGFRLWAAVCLALYVAFWLELDNAYWAGTSAAIVSLPSLGASLRKAWFRMIGTVIGAVAIVALTACFPQQRMCFLLGLAVWGAVCAFAATMLRNFAAYSAALAGYTAAIIASDELGAVGGANGEAFTLAVTRASEICIGILCAAVVLVGTDLGGARRRLAQQLGGISGEIAGRFAGALLSTGPRHPETLSVRRELLRRVIALDPVIDEALGEASNLRIRLPILHAGLDGLFTALSAWRISTFHLEQSPEDRGRREAELIHERLPGRLQSTFMSVGTTTSWTVDPLQVRRSFAAATRALAALPTRTPSLRLLADQAVRAQGGISQALDAIALLVGEPVRTVPRRRRGGWLYAPDWLPPFVSAARALVAIGAVELFWIVTAWPSGAQTIAFAAISVILFSARGDQAYSSTANFMAGTCLTAAFAAFVKFAVLPGVETFAGFSFAIGAVLVPAGALMAQPWRTLMFTAVAANFIPLLAPANPISYDTGQFYNSALAILAGIGAGELAFCLLPPLSPALQSRRLLALTLRDLRRLAKRVPRWSPDDWEHRVNRRLAVLPDAAEPLQRVQLVAALSVGRELIHLRRAAHRFDIDLDLALDAVARGESLVAVDRLADVDQMLAALPDTRPGARVRLRARGRILAMSEALTRHAAYFNSGVAP